MPLNQPFKIAIVGPESTGKSSLTRNMSIYFQGDMVEEVAREYLKEIQLDYTCQDILNIALLQKEREDKAFEKNKNTSKLIFCDTEWITIKIWLDYYQYEVPDWLIDGIENADYIHYLLTDIDIPWKPDPLRQNPNDRDDLFDSFKTELYRFKKPFSIVKGLGYKRLNYACNIISDL